jgi:membrane protein
VVGLLGLLWAGLGLVGALQQAMNTAWQVQGRGFKDKLIGLGWLAGVGVLFLASFGVVTLLQFLPGIFAPLEIVVGFALDFALWLWMMKVLPNRRFGWKPLMPGALLGAVGLQVLKVVGAVYVPHTVASSSALYGSLGVVFAILLWLLLFGKLFVYSCMLNVVLWERSHGTETIDVEVPRLPGDPPTGANRSGETTIASRT